MKTTAPMSRDPVTRPFAIARAVLSQPNDLTEQKADCLAERALSGRFGLAQGRAPLAKQSVLPQSGSRSLDPETRRYFEPRFGTDFSGVRVHTNDAAARSARALGARAFSVGRDIAFDSGEYQPHSAEGRELLAHELAHTVQPDGGGGPIIGRKIRVKPGLSINTRGFTTTKSGDTYSAPAVTRSSLFNEVFSSLLHSPREFTIAGSNNAEADKNLDGHLKARVGIVDFASKKKYTFAAGSAVKMNPDYWRKDTGSWRVKSGVDQEAAVNDVNVHPKAYAIACEMATRLTMVGGAKSTFSKTFAGSQDDWIPGDAGYILNTKFPVGGQAGLEGENLVYAQKGLFWGHFGPGNEYKTLKQWFDQVKSWHGGAEIKSHRFGPTAGLG